MAENCSAWLAGLLISQKSKEEWTNPVTVGSKWKDAEVEQEWFQWWSIISVRCCMKYKWLGGGEGERKYTIYVESWSHNNRSLVLSKTDVQQTGKTIDHIKEKHNEKKKKISLETMVFHHPQNAAEWAGQNSGLRSDPWHCNKQRNCVTLISLISFVEIYLENYVFTVYVSHLVSVTKSVSLPDSEYVQYSLLWVSCSLIYKCFGKISYFSVCWTSQSTSSILHFLTEWTC